MSNYESIFREGTATGATSKWYSIPNNIIDTIIFNDPHIASTSKLSTRLLQQSLETLLNITKVFEKSIPADEKSSKEESFIQLVAILMQRLQTVLKQLLSISLKKGLVSFYLV